MEIKDKYDIIFKRKSIRRYTTNHLDTARLEKIESIIKDLKPLHEDIETEIRIIRMMLKLGS